MEIVRRVRGYNGEGNLENGVEREEESTLYKEKSLHCTKKRVYTVQREESTLHKEKSLHCTKRRVYTVQREESTLYKEKSLHCVK